MTLIQERLSLAVGQTVLRTDRDTDRLNCRFCQAKAVSENQIDLEISNLRHPLPRSELIQRCSRVKISDNVILESADGGDDVYLGQNVFVPVNGSHFAHPHILPLHSVPPPPAKQAKEQSGR